MIKTTGAEFSRFYSDASMWPDGAWHEEELITVNGTDIDEYKGIDLDKIAPSDKVSIQGGRVFMTEDATDHVSLESHFRAWRKRQNTATLSVTVDKAKESQLRELLKVFGAKFS